MYHVYNKYSEIQKTLQPGDICNLEWTDMPHKINIKFEGFSPCREQGFGQCKECQGYARFEGQPTQCYSYHNYTKCPIVFKFRPHSIDLPKELFEI